MTTTTETTAARIRPGDTVTYCGETFHAHRVIRHDDRDLVEVHTTTEGVTTQFIATFRDVVIERETADEVIARRFPKIAAAEAKREATSLCGLDDCDNRFCSKPYGRWCHATLPAPAPAPRPEPTPIEFVRPGGRVRHVSTVDDRTCPCGAVNDFDATIIASSFGNTVAARRCAGRIRAGR